MEVAPHTNMTQGDLGNVREAHSSGGREWGGEGGAGARERVT
jgi:hypothetical protein